MSDDRLVASQTKDVGQIIDYQGFVPPTRIAADFLDWCFASLGLGCYILATYADSIMPGGYGWGYGWEFANFLMTIAALASVVVFIAGLARVLFMGHRRCPLVVIVVVWTSGVLPLLMFFLARRWLQMNFA
jgi:hypothetical protein